MNWKKENKRLNIEVEILNYVVGLEEKIERFILLTIFVSQKILKEQKYQNMFSALIKKWSEDKYSFDSFYNKFISICDEHRRKNRALVFAFILYDFQNPQISKMLKDPDYWLSLNQIAGKYLTVFSLHYEPTLQYKPQKIDCFEPNKEIITYSTRISDLHNPSESSNLIIEKYFGKDIQVKYPAVLFFQTDSEKIIDYTLIELDAQEIEQSFLELKNYILKAVETLKEITDENKSNIQRIFDNVEGTVKGERNRKVATRIVKKFTSVAELGSTLIGIAS